MKPGREWKGFEWEGDEHMNNVFTRTAGEVNTVKFGDQRIYCRATLRRTKCGMSAKKKKTEVMQGHGPTNVL